MNPAPVYKTYFTFDILVAHRQIQNVFVESTSEVAVQQFIVIDRLCYQSPNKLKHSGFVKITAQKASTPLTNLEVVEVFRIDVGRFVDHVRHHVARGRNEERIVGVENLTRDHREPFTQQTSCILTFFACKKKTIMWGK